MKDTLEATWGLTVFKQNISSTSQMFIALMRLKFVGIDPGYTWMDEGGSMRWSAGVSVKLGGY